MFVSRILGNGARKIRMFLNLQHPWYEESKNIQMIVIFAAFMFLDITSKIRK